METLRSPLQSVSSEQAPHASGPCSQAILADAAAGRQYVWSRPIALSPMTSTVVADGDVRAKTKTGLVRKKLAVVRAATSCRSAQVIKTGIVLTDRADFTTVNEIDRSARSGSYLPARALVQFTGLPPGVRAEIDAAAVHA